MNEKSDWRGSNSLTHSREDTKREVVIDHRVIKTQSRGFAESVIHLVKASRMFTVCPVLF